MKTFRCLLATGAAFAAGRGLAEEKSAATADQLFAEFSSLTSTQTRFMRDARWRTTAAADRQRITAAGAELVCAYGERLLADHPADPRRWDAVAAMFAAQRAFDGSDAAARQAAWEKRCGEFRAMVLAAMDAPAATVETMMLLDTIRTTRGKAQDLERALGNVEFLATRAPAAKNRGTVEKLYLDALALRDEAAAGHRLQQLAADPNPGVADMAKLKLGALAVKSGPVELKFPDLDGREIDLAKYRGRVVLLDFWATWCVPCMAEMPNLKAVYAKYHGQGFEIIGITDDILAQDPQNPKGSEKTVATLKAALVKEHMPWPQLWDTRVQDPPTVKRLLRQFDVHSLPTGMLFDQAGRLVTTDTQGDKLEAAVERLLTP